ncbi:LysR substrate-binding domain-containing protein [Ideonella sp. DXS29W]|uniref:LysR substrate-binding domain-containing protein n=1 Tax=Ideonella lacteola TaxID=2984193 RepID=A0ABU9BZZ9_9BURK
MNSTPDTNDLRVFCAVVRTGSFASASVDLGSSPAYVSKRIGLLERALGVQLFHRTTRRVQLTEEGQRAHQAAQRVLEEVGLLMESVGGVKHRARGHLQVCSSFGFGRLQAAPALAALQRRHPGLQVRLDLFDRLVDITSEGFDLDIRVGDEIAPNLIARRLARNWRVLCASPSYVDTHGHPGTVDELAMRDCLPIKERDHPFGLWRLVDGHVERAVKVRGPLASNNGEVVLQWTLQGHGIALRSLWQVGPLLASGRLVHVLPEVTQPADIWAVYPMRLERSAKLRLAVNFLVDWFGRNLPDPERV